MTDKSPSHLPKEAAVFSEDDIQPNVEFSSLFLREAAGQDSRQRGAHLCADVMTTKATASIAKHSKH